MTHANFDIPFEIHCDASPHAVGATLVQQMDEVERVILYISRTLKTHEQPYHQYEKEMLAVVWSVIVFRPYTMGRPFKLITDNEAVSWLNKSSTSNSRLLRWTLTLNAHRIEFQHRKGHKHGDADGLSRAFRVPADFVWEKNDVVEALCAQGEKENDKEDDEDPEEKRKSKGPVVKDCESREHYILPEKEDLIAQQKTDEDLKRRRTIFETLSKTDQDTLQKEGEGFFVKGDILFRRVEVIHKFVVKGKSYKRYNIQVCVPRSMRRAVLYSVHGIPVAGHDGVQRTREKLERNYWWKTYGRDITDWVSHCFYCQKRKTLKPNRAGYTGSLNTTRAFQVVGFDIVKLARSKKGNMYLLTMVDHFSRYPLAVPMPDRKLSTVVQALHSHLLCVFGMPDALLSDLEKKFVSNVARELLKKMGITKLDTIGYHPEGNSRVERWHRYLNAALTMFVNEHVDDWESYVDSLLFAYRTSMCTSTGFSPFELVFNRRAVMTPDVVYTADGKIKRE